MQKNIKLNIFILTCCVLVNGGSVQAAKRSANNRIEFASDLLETGFLAWLPRDTTNLNGPVRFYQRAPNGRTEVMEAQILPQHLNSGTATNTAARTYARQMGKNNDDAGHILARMLGGSGTDLRNIFPQNLNFNRGIWSEVEASVADAVRNNNGIRFTVNLMYHSTSDTRPYKLVYCIRKINNGEVITINDLLNP